MIPLRSKIGRIFLLFSLSTIILAGLFILIFAFILIKEKNSISNHIYPNVYINNIDFGKKDKKEIVNYFNDLNSKTKNTQITILYKNEPIATFSGEQLNIKYDSETIANQTYQIGRSNNSVYNYYEKFITLFNLKKYNLYPKISYNNNPIYEFTKISEDRYNKPAKNALFKFENGKVASFRSEENGLKIETEIFIKNLNNLINNLADNPKNYLLTLPDKVINPEITLAKSNDFGIEELLAVGKSDYTHSIPERIHNIILAASKFNGTLIPKNSILSFNDFVGDISSLTGYKPAYIIKNGRTVLGDGGGVCQVSTTLFRAALNAGLPIIERYAHAYRVGYYENDSKPGFDATVFSPTADLKVKNDTPAYILIQTEVDQDNNLLYFRFYGKKDNRAISISQPVIYDVAPPPPPLYQDDPTQKKGLVKQIDFSAWGAKTNFHYKVTYNNGKIIEQDFFSSYRPWQAIFLKGIAD